MVASTKKEGNRKFWYLPQGKKGRNTHDGSLRSRGGGRHLPRGRKKGGRGNQTIQNKKRDNKVKKKKRATHGGQRGYGKSHGGSAQTIEKGTRASGKKSGPGLQKKEKGQDAPLVTGYEKRNSRKVLHGRG